VLCARRFWNSGVGDGHAVARNLVSDAGEDNAVALGFYVGLHRLKNSEVTIVGDRSCCKAIACKLGLRMVREWSSFLEGGGIV
jgi:hypothetical protein